VVRLNPIRVLATPSPTRAAAAMGHGQFGIALHQRGTADVAGLGAALAESVMGLPQTPSAVAWDFLSIALAVFAADRFVVRNQFADAWTRTISLEVELADPAAWSGLEASLEATLRFLTSDIWYIRFRPGGLPPPPVPAKPTDRDCACLFSGGLDSLIGALDAKKNKRKPLLVSQASPKEGGPQRSLAARIGLEAHRFEGKASEKWQAPYEPSSRARSILFLGYGAVVASTLSATAPVDLLVPENGLISINAPLTLRHVGSLSTRTTHPHFISSLQAIFDGVGLNARMTNPYGFATKGEMLKNCKDRDVEKIAADSYSCGKGKRLNQHCGRCVPCLIRRASFHAAGLHDDTKYHVDDLSNQALYADVAATRIAAANVKSADLARWVSAAGPLPHDAPSRSAYTSVVRRGTIELAKFFQTVHWA